MNFYQKEKRKLAEILIGIALKQQIGLGTTDILPLRVLTHGHDLSVPLISFWVATLIHFRSLQFQMSYLGIEMLPPSEP